MEAGMEIPMRQCSTSCCLSFGVHKEIPGYDKKHCRRGKQAEGEVRGMTIFWLDWAKVRSKRLILVNEELLRWPIGSRPHRGG